MRYISMSRLTYLFIGMWFLLAVTTESEAAQAIRQTGTGQDVKKYPKAYETVVKFLEA